MKINEAAAAVGMSGKNLRFYEAEGLLTPRRNSQNGYREYDEAEMDTLHRIKPLRKLGFPLEEIRQMQSGTLTVGDGMRRHLVVLERERENLDAAARLCQELADYPERLEKLDAPALLARMEQMETEGTTFMNRQTRDATRRHSAEAVLSALAMALLMVGVIGLMLWSVHTNPQGAPPLPLLALLLVIPAVVILGVGIALAQRLRELRKNEAAEARDY